MKNLRAACVIAGIFVSSLVHADPADGVWTQIAQTGPVPPPGLELTALTYDSARKRAVYFAPAVGQTWALDLASSTPTWSQITTTGAPPTWPQLFAAFYDPQVDRMIVIGDASSGVWALSFTSSPPAWTILSAFSQTAAGNSSFAYDAAGWRLFDYGGTHTFGTEFSSSLDAFSALFLTWGTQSIATPPAGRAAASLLYDPNEDRLILHGGIATAPFTAHIANHDTWWFRFADHAWLQLPDGPAMAFAATIYDPARNRMVVFNRDAWQLSLHFPETWRQLSPDGTMDGSCDGMAAIYDPVNDRMVLYGGNGCTQTWQLLFDPSTPALASLVARDVTSSRVELTWQVTPGLEAVVERRTVDGDWSALVSLAADGEGRIAMLDDTVVSGLRYGYRLRWTRGAAPILAGEAWVDVPGSLVFRLLGATPNPSSGPMSLSFVLPSAGLTRIDLFDVRGRRVGESLQSWLPAGAHLVPLAAGVLPAGVYLARVTFGGTSSWTRAVSMR